MEMTKTMKKMKSRKIVFKVPFVRPWKRTLGGKNTARFEHPQTKADKQEIALRYFSEGGSLFKQPVLLSVGIQRHSKHHAGEYDTLRGSRTCDVDNTVKLIMDALIGHAYPDDAYVLGINAYKKPLLYGTKADDFMIVCLEWVI